MTTGHMVSMLQPDMRVRIKAGWRKGQEATVSELRATGAWVYPVGEGYALFFEHDELEPIS